MRRILESVAILALLAGLMCCAFDNPVDTQAPNPRVSPAQTFHPFALPANAGMQKANLVEATITAAEGGILSFSKTSGNFSMKISVTFGPNSVAQDILLDMIADDELLAATFGPAGTKFLQPGTLTIQASGLDLGNGDATTLASVLKLLYQNPDTGIWEEIPAAKFTADPATGTVTCDGGMIHHFSRYGFGM